MDKELAVLIQNACFRSARELKDLAPLVRDHCSPEDYTVPAQGDR